MGRPGLEPGTLGIDEHEPQGFDPVHSRRSGHVRRSEPSQLIRIESFAWLQSWLHPSIRLTSRAPATTITLNGVDVEDEGVTRDLRRLTLRTLRGSVIA